MVLYITYLSVCITDKERKMIEWEKKSKRQKEKERKRMGKKTEKHEARKRGQKDIQKERGVSLVV